MLMFMGKLADGREPFYVDERVGLTFVNNPDDGTDAYDVFVGRGGQIGGRDHIYIPARTMKDLTRTGINSTEILGMLGSSSGYMAQNILDRNNVSGSDLQMALLQVRIRELECQIDSLLL
jgi:hypothetical protein